MTQDRFHQASTCNTVTSAAGNRMTDDGRRIRSLPNASPKGGGWRTFRPKCRLPKSPCLAPTTRILLRPSRWTRPGCVPPPQSGEVRAKSSARARTRTGRLWRVVLSSFPHLTVCSKVDSVPSHCGSRTLTGFHNRGLVLCNPCGVDGHHVLLPGVARLRG